MRTIYFIISTVVVISIALISGCEFKSKNNKEVEALIKALEKQAGDSTQKAIVFDTTGAKGTFKDKRDKYIYKTIKIGTQIWMAENLRYAAKKGSMCLNDNDSNIARCGRLYEFEAAKIACPAGWRLPSEAEWDSLIMLAGGYGETGFRNLREAGPSGFDLCSCGAKGADGVYIESDGHYWTSTIFEKNGEPTWLLFDKFDEDVVPNTAFDPKISFSVRCIKDAEK